MQPPITAVSRLNLILAERGRISRELQESVSQPEQWRLQAEIVSLHEQEQEVFREITGSSECFSHSAFHLESSTAIWLWEEKQHWAIALYGSGVVRRFQVDPSILNEVQEAIGRADLYRIEQLIGGSGSALVESR